MKSLFATIVASYLLVAASAAGGPTYSYNPNPGWGGVCDSGQKQSPINIISSIAKKTSPRVKIETFGEVDDATVFFTGRSLEVKFNSFSKDPKVAIPANSQHDTTDDYVRVVPLQLHFHTNSEHTIDGMYFPAEMHIVCKVTDKDGDDIICPGGGPCLAVFGVLLKHAEKDATSTNSRIEAIFSKIPSDVGEANGNSFGGVLKLDELLPSDTEYFTYLGSLTTPPCSEIVTWHVFKNHLAISAARVVDHQALVAYTNDGCTGSSCVSPREKMNHRELQKYFGRTVDRIDKCDFVVDLLALLGGLLG